MNGQLPVLRSQFGWLLAMLIIYFMLAPGAGVDFPAQRILMNAAALAAWLFLLGAIFVPIELMFGLHRQTVLRPQLLVDVGYYFLTGLIPALVLAIPLALAAAIARELLPGSYLAWVASLPIGIRIIAALMIGELGFYWAHRAMHQVPALWKYHAPHHEPNRMDWLVNSRAHPIDIIFTRMCGLTLVAISGFGAPGPGPGRWVFETVLFASVFWAFLIHANVKWRFGPLEHILSSPRFHHWHHSRDDHPNHNYASMLPFYDRLFGSHHMPPGAWPPSYGIADENQPGIPAAVRSDAAPASDDLQARERTAR